MNNDNNQNRFPGLLGKLGKMTSIRDTALLEQSLLKTLGSLLGVLDSSLYRTDEAHVLVRVIHHHRSKAVDDSGTARMVERIEEVNNLSEIGPEVSSLIDNVRLLSKPCTRRLDQEMLIAYPLLGGNELCGYFIFQRDREVTPFEDAMVRGVLEVFSNYYDLLDASQRDRLTGLLNRQALENSFDRIWTLLAQPELDAVANKGRRNAHTGHYWLAVIDIDHFKKVNDTYGHMMGDEVLLLVSRLMEGIFRTSDLLYRYGGEEFIAIVSAESDDIARNIFERVRLAIEAHVFPRVGQVTISVGYSRADPHVLPQEVLGRADRALYQAKNDGRNRVYEYETLVKDGVFQAIDYGDSELF